MLRVLLTFLRRTIILATTIHQASPVNLWSTSEKAIVEATALYTAAVAKPDAERTPAVTKHDAAVAKGEFLLRRHDHFKSD